MADELVAEVEKLRAALAMLEAQRNVFGDALVPAIEATRRKIDEFETQRTAPARPDERRQITIFFSDVVGSVSLAEQLDPEDWRAVIGSVQHTIGSVVTARGGMIAQYQGDGLIAFFGADGLREGDVEQAVHAALEAQRAVSELALAVPVQIRIGLHTGPVLLGAWGAPGKIEFAAFGDAVNIAARLQSNAPPGGVLVSHDTYQHVRGVFELTPLQPLVLRGKSAPVQTYMVERARPRAFRHAARGVPGIQTPLIGRGREVALLLDRGQLAFEQRRVVWSQLVGEPGVGKSRLVDETSALIEHHTENVLTLRGRAFAGDRNQPFALVRRMWFDRFQIAEDTLLEIAQEHWVKQFCALMGNADQEPAHVLGLLMGLPFEDSPHLGALLNDPMQVRGRAFVVSREAVRALRGAQPLLILLEDLHWADASSLEYLQEVLLQDANAPDGDNLLHGVFVLATTRPEWDGLPGQERHRVSINPLSDHETNQLARELLKNVDDVPADVVQLIVERAEGVPYFIEELVNYFLDRGIIDRSGEPWRFDRARLLALHGTSAQPLPGTLQHLLRARLDALTDLERNTLQRGAIYGRNFWSGGVDALGLQDSARILPPLSSRGLVEQQPESALEGESEWSFHHALLRDVTYDSVLKRERPALHQKAGEWLERKAQESGRLDEFAGLLGEHAERGGEVSAAAEWYLRAGERANRQGASIEGRKFFDRALALLPPSAHDSQWRALIGREAAFSRLGERELQQTDIRALLELAEALDEDARRARALYTQVRCLSAMGEMRKIIVPAQQALAAAERVGDLGMQAQAMAIQVTSLTRLGKPERARALVAETRKRARASGDEFIYAQTLMQIALHYTDAGDLAEAVEPFTAAAEIARRLGNRALEGQILSNLGYAYAQLGLYEFARPVLEKTMELAQAVGERRDYAYGLQNLGWTFLCSGEGETAKQLEEQALREFTLLGDGFGRAASVLYLGHTAERGGDFPEAARHFADALELFSTMQVRGFMMDSGAGVARCVLAQGDLEDARERANKLLHYLAQDGTKGIEQPTLVYQTCANILHALGEFEKAREIIDEGYRELMRRADKISNPEWRESFLVNVPEHRAMVEMWGRNAN